MRTPARLRRSLHTNAGAAVVLVRLSVGSVFLSEGLQKFLFPAARGAGRFARIGLPAADLLGPLVGTFEVLCGALVLLGLLTRWAAIPLIGIMVAALVTTKIPILLGHAYWGLSLPELSRYGFWSMAHETRTDLAMLLGAAFLAWVGGGRLSLDARISRRRGR